MLYASKTARLLVLANISELYRMKTHKKRIWRYEWLKNRYISWCVYLLLIYCLSSNILIQYKIAAEIEQRKFGK